MLFIFAFNPIQVYDFYLFRVCISYRNFIRLTLFFSCFTYEMLKKTQILIYVYYLYLFMVKKWCVDLFTVRIHQGTCIHRSKRIKSYTVNIYCVITSLLLSNKLAALFEKKILKFSVKLKRMGSVLVIIELNFIFLCRYFAINLVKLEFNLHHKWDKNQSVVILALALSCNSIV